MEDVKDNTQDEFEKILQESIIFFKNEKKNALTNRSRNTQKENLIDALIKILEDKNNGIVHLYRLFEINKIEHAKQFTDAITLFLKRIETEEDDDYSLAKLEIGGALFEDMVNKYNNKYNLTISSTNDVPNSSLFRSNVKKINEDDIDEYDKGVKLTSKQFQTLFMDRRQKYYDNKSTREIMKVLGDALKNKKKIAEKILENTKKFLENKEAADKILQIFKDNIVNKELGQIEEAFNTAKTNIDNIEGLDNKDPYYTRIYNIKKIELKSYFERKKKEILYQTNNEITKKETIKEIEDAATDAIEKLEELRKQTVDESIKEKITDAIAAIKESKDNKKREIYIEGNAFLDAHIDDKIEEISNDVTKKFPTASQEAIGNIANEAISKLQAFKNIDGLSLAIRDKLENPNEIPLQIITKIDGKIQEIQELEKRALTEYTNKQIEEIVKLANKNIENETTIDGVNTIVMNETEKLQKLITQDVDTTIIQQSILVAIEELNNKKIITIEILKKKVDDDAKKIINEFSSSLDQKNPGEIRAIAQTNITKIQEIQGLTDEKKEDDLKKIILLEIKAHSNYFEGEITNKGKIKEIEDAATDATEKLEELSKQTFDESIQKNITDAIAAIKESKDKKKEEIDKEGKKLLLDRIKSEIVKISTEVTYQFSTAALSQEAIGNIATEAISKLQALKNAVELSDIKEKLIDSTTIPGEINTIIEKKIAEIQELKKNTLTQHANEKIEEEIKDLIATAKGILQGQDKGYKKSETINNIKTALETNLNKINEENFKQSKRIEYTKQLEDLEKEIMIETKNALIKNAKDVIAKARHEEELKATELKKTKDEKIKKARDKLEELVQKSGDNAHLHMILAKSIEEKEKGKKDKEAEIIKANAEVASAALELQNAQDESSKVDAPIMAEAKAKAEAATASKAEAKAKAEAAAAEQVTNYTLARIAHKDEKDKNKLIKASLNYDEFITDINKRLDNIIFLCNKYDFERINMLLKKLIVNHDYVAKNNNPNERKYSDLNSIDELTDKLLKKGEYYGMITYMDKNLNLINVKFDDFWAEYSGKIKQFYEESMSEDIQDINSKIVKILYKLKKLRYGDGKEQDTLPFDFALIADNAIIYKMNSYNFFKKIMKNLHIIQESIPDDANFEEFIAEQRQIFNSKFYRMYEILYRDFQNKLHASLDKIDIIKGRSKNNLSAIIKKLETPVIDDPENIAKAMSYADDLKIPIPDDEVVVPGVKDANITSILARVKSAKDELKTKTEEVSRLKGELSIIDTALLKLKDQNTSNEKERDKIEKEKNEIEENIKLNEQLKEDIQDDINIDKILKEKGMALMGIDDTTDKKEIELQKEWIKSIQNIEIEDKETFAYIMKAVNNTNAEESPSEQEEKVINRDSSG